MSDELPKEVKDAVGDRPMLDLNPIGHFMCPRHGEPFRAQWPKGFAQIIIMGCDFIAAPQLNFTDHIKGPADIKRLLGEKQVCCRIEPGELMVVYEKAEIGNIDLCDGCGKLGLGTPYKFTNFWGRLIEKKHLCFHCVLFNLKRR